MQICKISSRLPVNLLVKQNKYWRSTQVILWSKHLLNSIPEGKEGLEPFAQLLLDHASIADGKLTDHAGFAKRLQALMEKAA